MRQSIPLQWIEQMEATQVLTAALFNQGPPPPRHNATAEAAAAAGADLLARLRSWLALDPSPGLLMQAQPALVRRPHGRSSAGHAPG